MEVDEWRSLLSEISKKMYPSEFRYWPILCLLKPEFTMQIRMVMVYDRGGKALIVTKDENVYSLNYNGNVHLKTSDTHIGLHPKKIEALSGKNIKTFASNLDFALALTKDGEVYSWTFHEWDPHEVIPVLVNALSSKYIVDIACGCNHALALTNDGKVFLLGEIVLEEARYIFDNNLSMQVKHKLQGQKIVQVACGMDFNMVLTDTGKVYGWGYNGYSQISMGCNSAENNVYKSSYDYPHEMTALRDKTIVKVACGANHTLVLTDNGSIYTYGDYFMGKLGINNELKSSPPFKVDMPELISDIAANHDVSAAVDRNGTVYVWGFCFGEEIGVPFVTGFSRIHDAFAYSVQTMHTPLTMSTNSGVEKVLNILESYVSSLEAVFDNPATSDFIVQVEGQYIHVHRVILNIRCQHFRNKFQQTENNKRLQSTPEIYPASDFSYIIYKAFFKYLYTGKVDLPLENTLDLMKLVDKYCEINLKKNCVRIIEETITTSSVAFFYSKAIENNAKEFEELCFQFALCHMKNVVLSEEFNQLDISIKINFIQGASKENAFRT